MSLNWAARLSALAVLLLIQNWHAGLGAQVKSGFEFLSGDVTKLDCKVSTPGRDGQARFLTIAVKNRGRLDAEPLVFEIITKLTKPGAKPLPRPKTRAVRIAAASFGRAGRAVPAGRKVTYEVYRPFTNGKDARFKVRVLSASFFRGRSVQKNPIKILKRRRRKVVDPDNGEVTVTQVQLQNTVPFWVDAVFKVQYTGARFEGFCGALLAPLEKRWVGPGTKSERVAPARPNRFSQASPFAGELKSVVVVDWSVVIDDGEERAKKLLGAAWKKMALWPRGDLSIRGTIEYRAESKARGFELAESTGRAEFVWSRSGKGRPSVNIESALPSQLKLFLSRRVTRAFSHLAEIPWAEFSGSYRTRMEALSPIPAVEFLLKETKYRYHFPYQILNIQDQQIVGGKGGAASSFARFRQSNQVLRDGLVVPDLIEEFNDQIGVIWPVETRSLKHENTAGYWHPVLYESTRYNPLSAKIESTATLTFSDLKFEGSVKPPLPPSGAATERARAAWDKAYRYPDKPLDLKGRYAQVVSTTQHAWEKHAELKGRFKMMAWTGRGVIAGQVFEELSIKYARDPKLAEPQILEGLLRARYSIWARHDMAGRMAFDGQFVDAVLEPDPANENRIFVKGGKIAALTLARGLVVQIEYRDGWIRKFEFEQLGRAWVATRVLAQGGDIRAELKVKYRRLKGGRLFPGRLDIKGWFDAEWHEIYDFSKVKIVK